MRGRLPLSLLSGSLRAASLRGDGSAGGGAGGGLGKARAACKFPELSPRLCRDCQIASNKSAMFLITLCSTSCNGASLARQSRLCVVRALVVACFNESGYCLVPK